MKRNILNEKSSERECLWGYDKSSSERLIQVLLNKVKQLSSKLKSKTSIWNSQEILIAAYQKRIDLFNTNQNEIVGKYVGFSFFD